MAISDSEVQRRVLAGIGAEAELFGTSPRSRVLRRGGVIASICPATPDRSLFNVVTAADPADIEPALEELESTYREAGVKAWTVWMAPGHRVGHEVLASRGHVLDAMPRSMGVELADFAPPQRDLPAGIELRPARDMTEVGAVNDAAYGIDPGWGAAMAAEPIVGSNWIVADDGSGAVATAGTIAVEGDAVVTAVACRPESQGLGLASLILVRLLREAAEQGIRTASLQASKAGSPVYAKLGFRDVGFTEMWEKRDGPERP